MGRAVPCVALTSPPFPRAFRLMLPEEPPSAPPKNIVASGRTNQSIMVQWQPPPETEHNGVLRGYILRQVAAASRRSGGAELHAACVQEPGSRGEVPGTSEPEPLWAALRTAPVAACGQENGRGVGSWQQGLLFRSRTSRNPFERFY